MPGNYPLVLTLFPGFASAVTFTVGSGGNFDALDNALVAAQNGDTISLTSDINSTLSSDADWNITRFDKTVTVASNGFRILVNNTIQFSGDTTTVTFGDAAIFQYDTAGTRRVNASLNRYRGSQPDNYRRINTDASGRSICRMRD
jgi:hypothetical protein